MCTCHSLFRKYCPAGCLTSTEEISGTIPNGYREVGRRPVYAQTYTCIAFIYVFLATSYLCEGGERSGGSNVSWIDYLTAPPLRVRSRALSLTKVDDLMFRAWGCLIRSEGRKGAREGVVLLADGRIGRSVGLCFRERGAPQEQRRGRVSGWKGGEIIVWPKIITL